MLKTWNRHGGNITYPVQTLFYTYSTRGDDLREHFKRKPMVCCFFPPSGRRPSNHTAGTFAWLDSPRPLHGRSSNVGIETWTNFEATKQIVQWYTPDMMVTSLPIFLQIQVVQHPNVTTDVSFFVRRNFPNPIYSTVKFFMAPYCIWIKNTKADC